MQNKQVKNLLAVSVAAAMFASFGVQAQSSGQSAQQTSTHSAQGNPNLTGKAANDGTVGNTDSQGKEDRSAAVGEKQSGSTATSATAAGAEAKLSRADKKAIEDIAMANMAEVEAGKLALSKSQNAEVKAFAQKMVDDHSKALSEVQALAQTKGVTLPTELSAKHKAKAAMLEKLSGDSFDRSYIKHAGMADHKNTHKKLKKSMGDVKDPDVKALVAKLTPTVEQHLDAAEKLSASKSRGAIGTSGTPRTDSGK